jgi:hypothetical protein
MPRVRSLAVLGLVAVGCGGPTGVPVRELYGEVHLHALSDGSHAYAAFVGRPVSVDDVAGDTILQPVLLPMRSEGPCTLTLPTGCAPPCGPTPVYVDGGAVHLRSQTASVELVFDSAALGYRAQASGTFVAGAHVEVEGDGAVVPAFHGSLDAPAPVQLLSPGGDGLSGLGAVRGDLHLAWVPARATTLAVSLIATTPDGAWATIDCRIPDEPGEFSLPASLLDGLPAAPRALVLQVSRDRLTVAASATAEEGVLLHAGTLTRLEGREGL